MLWIFVMHGIVILTFSEYPGHRANNIAMMVVLIVSPGDSEKISSIDTTSKVMDTFARVG
jgi:hypothetical protein